MKTVYRNRYSAKRTNTLFLWTIVVMRNRGNNGSLKKDAETKGGRS